MKRLVSQIVAMSATLTFGIVTFAVSAVAPAHAQTPAPNFGSPPSGEIPILFNDQHVYTKPDRLRRGRVLAAIVRGKTILVPLRSMFEQMGATVSYNASTKTVDVSKPGADVQVTVGKPEVTINGETRPLDVPPEIYHGSLLVPVRVISEGMGAYVLWVPDRRIVVVRYISTIPATPPPAVAPTAVPTAAPTTSPTPTPKATTAAQFFLVGDAMFDPKVYNEFSPGNRGGTDVAGRAGATFNFGDLGFLAEGDFRQFRYPHRSSTPMNVACTGAGAVVGDSGCVTTLGPFNGSAFVPSFDARDTDIDGRLGIGIANPKIFLAGSYITRYGNYGYPRLTGIGAGLEKLTNYNQPIDLYGSVYYYPQITGDYTDIFGNGQKLQYRMLHYQAGLNIMVPRTPLFLDFGYLGDHGTAKLNAPSGFSENSFYGGLGLHF
ncbi:MAG: copper amine oxidase N-terminal domain-containing protein [Candidatus Eremiobacteraeota bacterium]|nr:copper amine oxidase N-terminal domain-containing protein [Candidatus Eremiobacteraeota bacterium]